MSTASKSACANASSGLTARHDHLLARSAAARESASATATRLEPEPRTMFSAWIRPMRPAPINRNRIIVPPKRTLPRSTPATTFFHVECITDDQRLREAQRRCQRTELTDLCVLDLEHQVRGCRD